MELPARLLVGGDGMGLEVRHRIIVFVVMATHGSLSTMLYGEIHNWIQTLPIVPVFSTSHPSILEARVPVIQPTVLNQHSTASKFSWFLLLLHWWCHYIT